LLWSFIGNKLSRSTYRRLSRTVSSRTGTRHHHNDDYENWFGNIDRRSVAGQCTPALHYQNREGKRYQQNSKDGFNLSEKMKQLRTKL
jgi:hypothetical protein